MHNVQQMTIWFIINNSQRLTSLTLTIYGTAYLSYADDSNDNNYTENIASRLEYHDYRRYLEIKSSYVMIYRQN